ncbi:MAG: UDP-N-acetylmuramoyl-tripeptide--D-alanyl-D-alanine ligase [Deltaproteobacteria bacterium]|nr:UDP-N-acetylmuramoyl-tripeptide--D-alanyl-D-alanine ligase [Deltaproteobacteria bacterium]
MDSLDLTLQEVLASVPGGRLLHAEGPLLHAEENGPYSEMVFDSRKIVPGCIFLCIKGERSDAHDFIPDAIRMGARLIIGQDESKLWNHAREHTNQFFIVSDPLVALSRIATFYRRKFQIPVIGLTGSSGKTTTKDLMASILSYAGPALVTEGTLNNHWGVPQMVMRLKSKHRAAVFEMGTSGFGEIQALASICQPDIGFITTIGASHLQNLKDEQGVLRAKRELFDWIIEHGTDRVLIFNLDCPYLAKLYEEFLALKQKTLQIFTLTQRKVFADVRLVSKRSLGMEHRYGWEYEFATPWGAVKGRLPLPGSHNLANAMAATTMVLASGIASVQDVAQGLDNPKISKLRSNLFRAQSGAVIYDDSYNSNPTSVTALFEAARTIRTNSQAGVSKMVAVVGDMLELGPESGEFHREMGRRAALDGVDVLLATGKFAREWVDGYRQEKGASPHGAALDFATQDDLMQALKEEVKSKPSETLILIKGSRGAKMDQIVDKIKN